MESKGQNYQVMTLSSEEIESLRRQFEKIPEVFSFGEDIKLASQVASYGLFREVGTMNDELARFIFNADTQMPVELTSLKAELIQWNNLHGIRIFSTESQNLELRIQGFYEVVHPTLSQNENGSLHSLFIFPEIISKVASYHQVELVLVRTWGQNSIFGGFDPSKGYYQTNFWELENNDTLKFADLVRQGKLAFMGTHDLIAHIAGIKAQHWPLLKETAQKIYVSLSEYFQTVSKPSIASLILPYTLGVVLDDLAQPPSYSSKSHLAVLEELLERLMKNEIPAYFPTLLKEFPESFQKVIDLSRTSGIEEKPQEIKLTVSDLIREIKQSSLKTA